MMGKKTSRFFYIWANPSVNIYENCYFELFSTSIGKHYLGKYLLTQRRHLFRLYVHLLQETTF